MSEIVVRMEMPNGCHDCRLRNIIGNCPIPMFDGQDEKKMWTLEECFQRPPWCPIVCALPDGHGRLIDIDSELNFQIADYEDMKARGDDVYSKLYSLDDVAHAINYAYDYADVVVPAEKRVE